MPKLLWFMICERAIVDRQTNEVSLIDIKDYIECPQTVDIYPFPLTVVSMWERISAEDAKFSTSLEVRFIKGDSEVHKQVIPSGSHTFAAPRMRNQFVFFDMQVQDANRAVFRVILEREGHQPETLPNEFIIGLPRIEIG